MNLSLLQDKIEAGEALLAVIGLGYVGFPVACQFAKAGFDVLGVDIHNDRIDLINQGWSPIDGNEPGLAELVNEVTAQGRLRATADYTELRDRDVILITVETPVDENNIPRYEALRSAVEGLGKVMKKGALVIVESTISPGTMEKLVLPTLEASTGSTLNEGFFLGHCPERVMPGKLLANLRYVSRVIGGMTPETAQTMIALYRHVVEADLDPSDCITAELVKTTENTYRDVQIAFANEVALICEAVGGDVWKVRELVNKTPHRQMHLPGAGVGGHCIPKDPWLLVHSVADKDVPLRLIPAAREINDSMPQHMYNLIKEALKSVGREISGARILILGYTYLADSDDTRNSPSAALDELLRKAGADVVIHDPYIEEYQGDIYKKAEGCRAVVIMVAHKEYMELDSKKLISVLSSLIIIDGRKTLDVIPFINAGYMIRTIGQLPYA